jgi:hypothetical protein
MAFKRRFLDIAGTIYVTPKKSLQQAFLLNFDQVFYKYFTI